MPRFIVSRLMGGAKGWGASSSSQPNSFMDTLKLRLAQAIPKEISRTTFIVDQVENIPTIKVDHFQTKDAYMDYSTYAIIF